MKSYTDIKQSRKLAEILPVESADMKFPYFGDGQYGITALFGEPIEFSGGKDIPAWSLAALIEQLPVIEGGRPLISINSNGECDMSYSHALTVDCLLYVHASNLLDACYELILKLHEQKLL